MKKIFLASSIFFLILGQNSISPNVSVRAEPSQPTQMEKPPEPTTIPQVTILDLGTEPRQQLRVTPVVGSKQTIKMKFVMEIQMTVDNEPMLNNAQFTMEMTMNSTVKKVEPNGDIHFDFVYSKADMITNVDESIQKKEEIRSSMSELVGLSASVIVDAQGRIKKSDNFVFPKKMSSEIQEMIMKQFFEVYSHIYPPLPTEAVGIGAKWKVNPGVSISYFKPGINQNIIYELVNRQDNLLSLGMTVEQQAEAQNSIPLDKSSETSAQIVSMSSLGDGKITMDLSQIMPIDYTSSIKSNMVMKKQIPEREKALLTNMTIVTNLSIQSQ